VYIGKSNSKCLVFIFLRTFANRPTVVVAYSTSRRHTASDVKWIRWFVWSNNLLLVCRIMFVQSSVWTYRFHSCRYVYLRNRLPVGGGRVHVLQMFFLFFFVFSVHQNYETTVLGNGWTDFHETFTKRYRGNVVWNVVPPLGESRAAAWRMANVDDCVIYDMTLAESPHHHRAPCTAVALYNHERANGCNLVLQVSLSCQDVIDGQNYLYLVVIGLYCVTRNSAMRTDRRGNWNSLPLHIRSSDSLAIFQSRLKSHLFVSAYHV